MSNNKPNTNDDRIAQLENRIAQLESIVTNLVSTIESLNKIATIVTGSNNKRTVRTDLKYNDEQIRDMFYMALRDKMSGYAIGKAMNENATYVYNVLKRKIYVHVDISDIVEEFGEYNG